MAAFIISALVWWGAEIAAGVLLGYKAAIFGALMSFCTAGLIAWMMKEEK